MAENLDDGEFWLPPQFLTDDDFTTANKTTTTTAPFVPKEMLLNRRKTDDALLFPAEFPYRFASSSDLSSPVESLSSETESDEEEQLVAELTRRMTRSTLSETNNNMGRFVSGSPQSTLCAFGNGCGCRKGSSQGSPNGVCKVSSARATWDLLHAAAGEVERMRLNQESYGYNNNNNHNHNGVFVSQRKPSPITPPTKNNITSNDLRFYQQQLQLAQIQMLRQQQVAKQQQSMWGVQKQNVGGVYRGRNVDVNGGVVSNNRPLGLSTSAWPTLQNAKQQQQPQQYGSGMRAVFLGNPSGRRECAGTGVFLPRRVDSPAEPKKKPACNTALVPARVAQALNLKLEDYMVVGCQPQQHLENRFNANSNIQIENAGVARVKGNYVFPQQKGNNNFSRPQPAAVNNEIRLPQEWTY